MRTRNTKLSKPDLTNKPTHPESRPDLVQKQNSSTTQPVSTSSPRFTKRNLVSQEKPAPHQGPAPGFCRQLLTKPMGNQELTGQNREPLDTTQIRNRMARNHPENHVQCVAQCSSISGSWPLPLTHLVPNRNKSLTLWNFDQTNGPTLENQQDKRSALGN